MKRIGIIMIIVLVGLLFTATAYSHETKYAGGYIVFIDNSVTGVGFTKCKNIHLSTYGVFTSNHPLTFDNEGSANRWPAAGQNFKFFPYTAVQAIFPTTE